MVLIPLGLRAKLYIKPWATISIAVLTIAFTIWSLMGRAAMEDYKQQTFEKYSVYERTYRAMGMSCRVTFLDQVCDFFERYVKPADLAQPADVVTLIQGFEAFDQPTKAKVSQYIQNLNVRLNEQSEALQKFKTYQDYTAAFSEANQDIEQYYADHYLLSNVNTNWLTLTVAQLRHNNWWTLLANLLILGLFSLFLEQRVGPVFFVLIYAIGGYVGLSLQASFLGPFQVTAGATANVMAIVGAYVFFFFKEEVRIYVNFLFAVEKKFLIPVWLYAGLFAILGNIFYLGSETGSNLVLWSHLAGLGTGVLCGLIVSLMNWVQKDFLFAEEQTIFFKAKKTKKSLKKIKYMLEVLAINPQNFVAVEYMFRSLAKRPVDASAVPEASLAKMCRLMVRMINQEFRVNPAEAYSILSLIPLNWNFNDLPMPKLGRRELRKIESDILEHDWRLAIRFYDLYLHQHDDPDLIESIQQTVHKVIVQAEGPLNPQSHQNIEWLHSYALYSGKGILGRMIRGKYEDITMVG